VTLGSSKQKRIVIVGDTTWLAYAWTIWSANSYKVVLCIGRGTTKGRIPYSRHSCIGRRSTASLLSGQRTSTVPRRWGSSRMHVRMSFLAYTTTRYSGADGSISFEGKPGIVNSHYAPLRGMLAIGLSCGHLER